MKSKEYRSEHLGWYVCYVILNIFSFGSLWIWSNLIAYSVSKSHDQVKK